MKAQENSVGGLRKDFAGEIGANEDDGDFLGDAAASTHNLL